MWCANWYFRLDLYVRGDIVHQMLIARPSMYDDLILIGWSIDAGCAAAMLNRQYPKARLLGASKRKLATILEQVKRAKRVHIVGIGLEDDPESMLQALERLRSSQVEVRWLSVRPAPEAVAGLLQPQVFADSALLIDGLAEPGNLHETWLAKIARGAADSAEWRQLLNAAMSRYRRFGDETVFPDTVAHLARSQVLTRAQRELVAEFESYGYRELRGHSPQMSGLRDTIGLLGREGRCSVLITGETGTGKETAAYLVHRHSPRAEEPFWAFNCADLSPQLLESRLFGHEKGAFTGALEQRDGAFSLADNGTLFLDEVGELSMPAQAGLLRVLQEQRFRRIGGSEELKVNVRIVSATNRDLAAMMREGTFRTDLFYRLSTVRLEMPALRERIEDIAEIANDLLYRKGCPPLAEEQCALLAAHDWPGNIRELQNVLERAAIFGTGKLSRFIDSIDLDASAAGDETLQAVILRHVRQVYARHEGNLTHAARALGISVNTLKKYLRISRS
ncbi:MAG: DNA-binding NtrC family response regulator [Rhodothermales bacterium]|jgi:DNA-binding NtrC family response regulator